MMNLFINFFRQLEIFIQISTDEGPRAMRARGYAYAFEVGNGLGR